MKATDRTPSAPAASKPHKGESSTTTAAGDDSHNEAAEAASHNAAIAGNLTADEIADDNSKHKMKKGKWGDADFWVCQDPYCMFNTLSEEQAREHERSPR